jgi:hypothetical protein
VKTWHVVGVLAVLYLATRKRTVVPYYLAKPGEVDPAYQFAPGYGEPTRDYYGGPLL